MEDLRGEYQNYIRMEQRIPPIISRLNREKSARLILIFWIFWNHGNHESSTGYVVHLLLQAARRNTDTHRKEKRPGVFRSRPDKRVVLIGG
jgi:hypothetical protein